MVPHEWHQNYSLPFTTYLGPLGCRVASKGMGICEAERHWKANKKIRGGQRAKLSPENAKKQATIAANHSMERSALRHDRAMQAGMLWDDKDFETCKLGENVVFHFVLLVTNLIQPSHVLSRAEAPFIAVWYRNCIDCANLFGLINLLILIE